VSEGLLNSRIRDYVEALIADGEEGDRLPTMSELRRRFDGASNGAVQQALEPLKASGAVVTTRGPQGGHFIGPKAAAEPRSILRELRARLDAAAAALRAAGSLLGELEDGSFGSPLGSGGHLGPCPPS
jgi:DNA-binding GntR family transcriptional regulator